MAKDNAIEFDRYCIDVMVLLAALLLTGCNNLL